MGLLLGWFPIAREIVYTGSGIFSVQFRELSTGADTVINDTQTSRNAHLLSLTLNKRADNF